MAHRAYLVGNDRAASACADHQPRWLQSRAGASPPLRRRRNARASRRGRFMGWLRGGHVFVMTLCLTGWVAGCKPKQTAAAQKIVVRYMEAQAAWARMNLASNVYQRSVQLHHSGAISQQELDVAAANKQVSEAEWAQARQATNDSVIRAPGKP